MPDTPTPSVNGQSLSGPALHASMSMLSLDPAASTVGLRWSTTTAGSFCLFCENGVAGLPLLTRTDCALAGPATTTNSAAASVAHSRLGMEPPWLRGAARPGGSPLPPAPIAPDHRTRARRAQGRCQSVGPIGNRFHAGLLGTVCAAEHAVAGLHAVADDPAAAVLAGRRQRVDRALERVEHVARAVLLDGHRLV